MDKPRLDQGPDYERGFIDGMMYQIQTTVNKAVGAMSKRTWVGLTNQELADCWDTIPEKAMKLVEAKLKEKNERTL
jgi:hypothetical protein